MTKLLSLLLVGGLVAGVFLVSPPDQPSPGDLPGLGQPLYSVCPVVEGGGRSTDLAVLSTDDGPVQLTLFANGSSAGSIGVSTGSTGVTVIPVVDVAAVGTVGGLIELPSGSSAAGSTVRGASTMSVESCITSIPSEVFLTGGVTASQRAFSVHLMNPFAGDAVVSLTVTSEVGLESSPRYQSVIVPSRGSHIVDFSQLAPGRERLSVRVDTSAGRVIAVASQGGVGDGATWNAVSPATDWFVPVPTGGQSKRVLIGNPSSNVEVEFQVDLYGPAGFEAAALSGEIPPGGEESLDLAAMAEVRAVRVISTSPVVPTLWIESESMLGVTNGATEPASRWLLPAALTADAESARIVIHNPGLEDAALTIRSLRTTATQVPVTVSAESVVELALVAADGYVVDATLPVVVLLVALGDGYGAAVIGVPLVDG
jgi:hypothetical protein